MNINDIINDALHYPLSDYKNFLVLGLPNLILSIVFFVLIIQAVGLDSISNLPPESIISSPIFTRFIYTIMLFIIVSFIGVIIIEGIQISVIRETIRGNDVLPKLKVVDNFVDGLKCLVLSIIYFMVITLIYIVLSFISITLFKDYAGFVIIILTVLLIITMIFLSFIFITALCRLAETNSLGEALNIRNVYEISKNIGFRKIFAVMVFSILLSFVISIIGSVLGYIPIIGFFISSYVLYTFLLLASSRSYGLMYRKYLNRNRVLPGDFGQTSANATVVKKDEMVKDDVQGHSVPQTGFDFQQGNEENVVDSDVSMTTLKKCGICGYSNPDYANVCSNCGNKL